MGVRMIMNRAVIVAVSVAAAVTVVVTVVARKHIRSISDGVVTLMNELRVGLHFRLEDKSGFKG